MTAPCRTFERTVSSLAEPARVASPGNDETVTARTLWLLGRVLDGSEVHITLVAVLPHVFKELAKGKGTVSTSPNRAIELRVRGLMLVADMLSQVILPKEDLVAVFSTAIDERRLVSRRTSLVRQGDGRARTDVVGREGVDQAILDGVDSVAVVDAQ